MFESPGEPEVRKCLKALESLKLESVESPGEPEVRKCLKALESLKLESV